MKPFHPKAGTAGPLDGAAVPKAAAGPLSPDERTAITTRIARLRESDFSRDEDFRALADALVRRGRFAAAEELYKRLIQAADYTPKDYLSWYSPPLWRLPGRMSNQISFVLRVAYPELTKVLLAQGKHEEALEYMSRGRSRQLEAVVQRRVRGSASLTRFADSGLTSARQLAKDLDATLVLYAAMSPYDGERDPQTNAIWAWVVQQDGKVSAKSLPFHLLRQIDPNEATSAFTQAVMAFHGSVPRGVLDRVMSPGRTPDVASPRASGKDLLRKLHQILIEPLKPYLPKDPDRQIIIVPDGDLFVVPFNALIDEEGKYLVDRHTVSLAPSVGSLALLLQEQKSRPPSSWRQARSAVVVGDPLMPSFPPGSELRGELTQLDGADREAQEIAKLLGVSPLLGAGAREDVVSSRIKKAQIIHFATHGLLAFDSILTIGEVSGSAGVDLPPGAIVLAANPKAKGVRTKIGYDLPFNGFLTAGKILLLGLDAELVTLSACDTARGRTDQHQFAGLPNALLAAGARTVVMTLWAIPDAPTSELMVTFYKELLSGQSKVAALRRAILATKGRYPDLENWGAFTLFGLPI